MSCEDQALVATTTCTKCRAGFDDDGEPIYAKLVKRGRFWCCESCGLSYGTQPHPELVDARRDTEIRQPEPLPNTTAEGDNQ